MPTKKTVEPGRTAKKKRTKDTFYRATEWWHKEKRKMSSARLCDRCEAVWFDGHWHDDPRMAAALKAAKKSASGKKAKPLLCHECQWAVHGPADPTKALFEGQVTLDGLDDPSEKAKVLARVRSFGARASKRDPEDRIIAIEDRGGRVVVTTSENQMAAGLGKAIDSAFKGGKLRIVWSKDDLPVRVFWIRKTQ